MESTEAIARLTAWFEQRKSALVCYSGGVDSALVMAVAHRTLGGRAIAMTATSPSLPSRELEEAVRVARDVGADHRIVESHELERPEYRQNLSDRCFHCKSELYRIASARAAEWNLDVIVNGTNLDDLGDFRPGLEAAREANVLSPLVDLAFTKPDVRGAAEELGLSVWHKPAAACLSSRIPFGTEVTPARLAQVGALEAELLALGLGRVRVRYHPIGPDSDGHALARIELDASDIPRAAEATVSRQIVAAAARHGFLYATLDLAGYRTGSHNEVLRRKLPLIER